MEEMNTQKCYSRREFLKTATAVGAALTVSPALDKVQAAISLARGEKMKEAESKHSVNHVFSSPTSIINFTSKKPSYDDTRRSGRDNELLQRAQNDL